MLQYGMLAGFISFSIVLALFVIRIVSRGISIVARPPINPLAFVTAKLCAFSSCFFIPAGIIRPELKWYEAPEWLGLTALLPFFSGIVIAAVAMKKLGDDLIFGLPEGSISSLKTDGIFRFSRNPLYLGFILLILSSCLITPNPFNFAAAIIAILIHHRIILQEENYLLSRLGDRYKDYMKATGRYLLRI
ncbi:MAG: isoprenylcysteine carboxylmethyltransferase family protein [Spirochaetes bacterium]|nr:isoprenylcysteine carboxylmethyltransferase family protein [Spirochaetota bacterium]